MSANYTIKELLSRQFFARLAIHTVYFIRRFGRDETPSRIFMLELLSWLATGSMIVESRYTFLQSFYGVSVVVRK